MVHRLTHTRVRGQVHHHLRPVEQRRQRVAIAHVADDEACVRVEVGGWGGRGAVDLRGEGVEDRDLVAARQQGVDQVGADEPGPAGDQHPFARDVTAAHGDPSSG